jgi:molecular chaperone GrpE (heat shock protein)
MSENRVNKWGKLLVAILLLPAAIVVPVLSLESHYAPPTQAQTQPDSAQAQRVAAYKAALGRDVQTTEQAKVKLRCSVAQTNAKTLATRISTVQKGRNAAYDSILQDLSTLNGKLNKQAFETTGLQDTITMLQAKVDAYKTDMNSYQLAVNDMATVNCAADPVAFIAALQAARKAHDAVQVEITDIRAYITNSVKPTLVQIRTQIANGQTTGGTQ